MSNFEGLMSDIRAGNFLPVYFFCGEETYFIDALEHAVTAHALTEEEKAFNQTIVYGRDTDESTILGEAKRYPMIGNRQLVVVREAQHLKKLDEFAGYLDQPQPSTVLVFSYKKKAPDARKAFGKKIKKLPGFFEAQKLWERDHLQWISKILKSHGFEPSDKPVAMIYEFLGGDLARVDSEASKLRGILGDERALTPQVIEKYVGISKDYNNFELIKALSDGDQVKAFKIVQYFSANPKNNPIQVTIATLFGFYRDLFVYHTLKNKQTKAVQTAMGVNYYKALDLQNAAHRISIHEVSNSISAIRDWDMRSKGVGNDAVDSGGLLSELVQRLFARMK